MMVTYTIDDSNWILLETYLYVCECGNQPMNGQGNPQVGRFPHKEVHEGGLNEFTYTINMNAAGITTLRCVAAHASVVNADGTVNRTA